MFRKYNTAVVLLIVIIKYKINMANNVIASYSREFRTTPSDCDFRGQMSFRLAMPLGYFTASVKFSNDCQYHHIIYYYYVII